MRYRNAFDAITAEKLPVGETAPDSFQALCEFGTGEGAAVNRNRHGTLFEIQQDCESMSALPASPESFATSKLH